MDCKTCGQPLPTTMTARILGVAPDDENYPYESEHITVVLDVLCPTCKGASVIHANISNSHILATIYGYVGEYDWKAPFAREVVEESYWTWDVTYDGACVRFGIRDEDIVARAMAEDEVSMLEYILFSAPFKTDAARLTVARRWVDVSRPKWQWAESVKWALERLRMRLPDLAAMFEDELTELVNHVHYIVYEYPNRRHYERNAYGPFETEEAAAAFMQQRVDALGDDAVIVQRGFSSILLRVRGRPEEMKYEIESRTELL